MEQKNTDKTDEKPLSVLERFRQLSRQKDQQSELTDVKARGDVGAIYLTSDKTSTKFETEDEFLPRKNFQGRRGRGVKRVHDNHSNPRVTQFHQGLLEHEIGITEYVTPGPGFKGIIKQRFSDFQVNEIDLSGNAVKLTNTELPVEKEEEDFEIEDELSILTKEQWDEITKIYETKNEKSLVQVEVTNFDKEKRTKIHKAVKKKFGVYIYSNTVDIDGKKFMQIGVSGNRDSRMHWPRGRGEYLHFAVHKENTDSTETVHTIAHRVKVKSNKFSYAGTKDKRAVTTQRMCVRRISAEKLQHLNIRNIWLGNFEYKWRVIRLGDLKGNRFRIALREVDADDEVIEKAVTSLREKGFLNYFGTQRFGSSLVSPTHMIGKAILQSDWKQAVELILKPRPMERGFPDLNAARDTWWKTRDPRKALKCLNFKDKTIEGKILQGLDKNGSNAYLNALENLPKNTLSLYSHAYQSLLWNKIISRRVSEFGLKPIEGDLVFVDDDTEFQGNESESEEDENDKESSEERKDEHIRKKLNVRVLSEAEAKETSIFDIVYPLPGYDVIYPKNVTAQWFKDLLAQDGLTSEGLQQKNRWFSLFGSYRKILNKPTEITWKTLHYNDHNMDLIISDRGILQGVQEPIDIPDGKYKALILEFNLIPSGYATMALRELLKCETASCHQAALSAKSLNSTPNSVVKESTSSSTKQNHTLDANINEQNGSDVNGDHFTESANKKKKLEEIELVVDMR